MKKPIISIVVPVYNVEKYLERCIESIIAQTFKEIEIILVNDGSEDRSGEICDKYKAIDNRITVIHKKNGGLSEARNVGIEVARGEWLGFVDSDDHIAPDMYEFLYGIVTNEDADIGMCEFFNCYYGKKVVEHAGDYYEVMDSIGAIRCVMEAKITSVTAVNKIYRKSLFDNLRFKVGKTAEDAFIMIDLLDKADRIVITNKQKYYYYHRAGSITKSEISKKDLDAVEAYEYNAKRVISISQSLKDVALLRQCWARFYVLDKMMLSDKEFNKEIRNEYIKFLKKNTLFIIKSNVFTTGRKVGILVLHINIKLYKKLIRFNTERNRKANG